MKNFAKILILLMVCSFGIDRSQAQDKILGGGKFKHIASDSLLNQFRNTVYSCFYSASYSFTHTPTFAVLKIDIDQKGRVTNIRFSDSADSTFLKAWLNKPNYHDDKATLEQYAKLKSYKNISLLLPVSYEPMLPNSNQYYTNNYLESYLKFDKKDFTGNAIMLSPIFIKVLARGEM